MMNVLVGIMFCYFFINQLAIANCIGISTRFECVLGVTLPETERNNISTVKSCDHLECIAACQKDPECRAALFKNANNKTSDCCKFTDDQVTRTLHKLNYTDVQDNMVCIDWNLMINLPIFENYTLKEFDPSLPSGKDRQPLPPKSYPSKSGSGYDPNHFQFNQINVNWQTAFTNCQSNKKRLVVVDSLEKHNFLVNKFLVNELSCPWIDISNPGFQSPFIWYTNQTTEVDEKSFSYWATKKDETDSSMYPVAACMNAYASFKWVRRMQATSNSFICEEITN